MSEDSSSGGFSRRVVEVVRRVPQGRVVTYGQVAALAGRPGAARQVGYVLAGLPDSTGAPWHRVINARGAVSRRGGGDGVAEGYQRHLLEEEGVEFDEADEVDMKRYRWDPLRR